MVDIVSISTLSAPKKARPRRFQGPRGLELSVHPHTVHTLLLYSPVGLDVKLAKRALKDSLEQLTPGLNSVA